MNQLIDAAFMRETASRGQIAAVYGVAGLAIGLLMFSGNRN